MRLEIYDYECPQCGTKLEEDVDEHGNVFRFCEECGKSFNVDVESE